MTVLVESRFSAQVVVAMAVVAGAWHLGVRSLHRGLAEARAGNMSAHQEIAAHASRFGSDASSPDDSINRLEKRESAMFARSTLSADAAKIYEALGAIATARSVRIDRIEPARGPVRDAHLRTNAPGGATCEAVGYAIEATGEYADLASFIDAVQTELGITKILSIRIGPASAGSSRTMLSASIDTAHFRLVPAPKQGAEKENAK